MENQCLFIRQKKHGRYGIPKNTSTSIFQNNFKKAIDY